MFAQSQHFVFPACEHFQTGTLKMKQGSTSFHVTADEGNILVQMKCTPSCDQLCMFLAKAKNSRRCTRGQLPTEAEGDFNASDKEALRSAT